MVRFGDIRPLLSGWGISLITTEDNTIYLYKFTYICVWRKSEITLPIDHFDDYFVKEIDVSESGGATITLEKGDEE